MAARPTVHIPAPEADRPSWLRVGAVALVGFALGIAWPRIAGVRLGPAAPAEAVSAVAMERAAEAASAAAASASAAAPPPPTATAAPPAPVVSIHVGRGIVLSCKNDDGDTLKGRDCGAITGLDSLVQTRLEHLSQAPAVGENPGKLNVVLGLDFKRNRISVESGRSSTVKDVTSLKAFVAGEVKSMSLKSVDHQYERYSIVYVVHIARSDEKSAETTSSVTSASATAPATPSATPTPKAALPEGEAAVAWNTAIVRDAPHTGAIVAHLPRGARVQLGASQGGWYKIKYGPSFSSEGYVYRGAIGK